MLVVAIGALAYPYLFNVLNAIAYGFILPAVAVLHVRHAVSRRSGAVLGTIAGTGVAVVGLAGSANVDVRPASLFVLGMWWWTIGKMWVQTGVMPRLFGQVTAVIGLAAFVLVPVEAFSNILNAAQPWFGATHVVLGIWLLALSAFFAREAKRPAAG